MLDTISRFCSMLHDERTRSALYTMLTNIGDRLSSVAVAAAGLVISTDTFTAKIGATDFYALVGGRMVKIVAGTALPSLTTAFNVTLNTVNVVAFYVNGSGTVTAQIGTQAATLGAVVFPPQLPLQALVGFVILAPTGGNFVGGSTALSGTSANAVYVSPTGAIDPTILVS